MKITTRYMINFGFLTAGILLTFSIIIIVFYYFYRSQDFSIRLRNQAVNTAILLFDIKEVTSPVLKNIDDRALTTMSDVTVIILDNNKKLVYCNRDSNQITKVMPSFRKLNWRKEESYFENRTLYICLQRKYENQNYYILASGIDHYGRNELHRLFVIISISFLISQILIFWASYFNAKNSIRPIKSIIRQVEVMNPGNLNDRLTITSEDEIAELSNTFNNMLARIEKAFENERKFVSNVSHEMRTPVTSIIGQLEVALLKKRNETEYEEIVRSVLDDMRNMKIIINGFLALAESSVNKINHVITRLRIDELLFSVKDELVKHSTQSNILIEFENLPEDENDVSILGNEQLLKMLIVNLIDNSCKFSDPPEVTIKIAFTSTLVILRFIDQGIGIPEDDLDHIFNPLYRAKNVQKITGHGIGLSIVKQIADLHGAKLDIVSELYHGTTISITFPVVPKA